MVAGFSCTNAGLQNIILTLAGHRLITGHDTTIYVIVKAPPRVCMENTARGDVSRG